ncbi:MAG: hypothetical protein IIW23_00955 [Clostridia bacterium]|nr:hypothetical protein [Clostridia bacterium]
MVFFCCFLKNRVLYFCCKNCLDNNLE